MNRKASVKWEKVTESNFCIICSRCQTSEITFYDKNFMAHKIHLVIFIAQKSHGTIFHGPSKYCPPPYSRYFMTVP